MVSSPLVFMSALLKESTKRSTCLFDYGRKGGVLMFWMPLSAQKFENVAEVNAVSLSETNICGIPK